MNMTMNIEDSYTKATPLSHRKKFAQFFTPPAIAELMCEWLLGNKTLENVLEPAFGLGIFSRILLSERDNLKIKGFDIDNLILSAAKKEFSGNENIKLQLNDYIYNDWDNKYDGIICNPPYFKFHDYDNHNYLNEIEHHLDCKLKGFTNLYTLFLLKSIHQLHKNGRCAYIVPSEFMNSDYGVLIKRHLLKTKTLRHVIIFDSSETVFDNALTTACLILCANDHYSEQVSFTTINTVSELNAIHTLITEYPNRCNFTKTYNYEDLDASAKWKIYYQDTHSRHFNDLVPFSNYAKVMRGIATGANDYFTFNRSKSKHYNINERYLLPCICKCADVKTPIFTSHDFESLKTENKKVFLLNAINSQNTYVVNYLKKGVEEGIDKKYLTASRNPWFALEKRPPAPIWVSVFNRNGLRFVRNIANIANLTTFHCVYPNTSNLFSSISTDLLFAYLLTDTAKSIFDNNSREYGNGLNKFEPNDLNNSYMLDLAKLPNDKKRKIEIMMNDGGKNPPIKEIDTILNEYFLR